MNLACMIWAAMYPNGCKTGTVIIQRNRRRIQKEQINLKPERYCAVGVSGICRNIINQDTDL